MAGIGKNKKDYVNWIGFVACLLLSLLCHRAGYIWMLLICSATILLRLYAGHRQVYTHWISKLDRCLPLSYLARISLPLYLTHQNIGRGIIQKMEQAGVHSELLILLTACGACILLADILHRCVEKPLTKLQRKREA